MAVSRVAYSEPILPRPRCCLPCRPFIVLLCVQRLGPTPAHGSRPSKASPTRRFPPGDDADCSRATPKSSSARERASHARLLAQRATALGPRRLRATPLGGAFCCDATLVSPLGRAAQTSHLPRARTGGGPTALCARLRGWGALERRGCVSGATPGPLAGLPRPGTPARGCWHRLGAQVVERPFRAGEGKGGSGAGARQLADPGCRLRSGRAHAIGGRGEGETYGDIGSRKRGCWVGGASR